tara:strand:- start:181 stop:297 length:117 start_codon:yes stop_codon:yes gene_type:complete
MASIEWPSKISERNRDIATGIGFFVVGGIVAWLFIRNA